MKRLLPLLFIMAPVYAMEKKSHILLIPQTIDDKKKIDLLASDKRNHRNNYTCKHYVKNNKIEIIIPSRENTPPTPLEEQSCPRRCCGRREVRYILYVGAIGGAATIVSASISSVIALITHFLK